MGSISRQLQLVETQLPRGAEIGQILCTMQIGATSSHCCSSDARTAQSHQSRRLSLNGEVAQGT